MYQTPTHHVTAWEVSERFSPTQSRWNCCFAVGFCENTPSAGWRRAFGHSGEAIGFPWRWCALAKRCEGKQVMCLKLEDFKIFCKFIFEYVWTFGSLLEVPSTSWFCHCGISMITLQDFCGLILRCWQWSRTFGVFLTHWSLAHAFLIVGNMLEPLASVARWRRAVSSALSNCPLCVLNVNERNQVFPTLQWWVGSWLKIVLRFSGCFSESEVGNRSPLAVAFLVKG